MLAWRRTCAFDEYAFTHTRLAYDSTRLRRRRAQEKHTRFVEAAAAAGCNVLCFQEAWRTLRAGAAAATVIGS